MTRLPFPAPPDTRGEDNRGTSDEMVEAIKAQIIAAADKHATGIAAVAQAQQETQEQADYKARLRAQANVESADVMLEFIKGAAEGALVAALTNLVWDLFAEPAVTRWKERSRVVPSSERARANPGRPGPEDPRRR